jgi:ABC-type glycerol-3-phosphate transport system permease component
MGRALLRLLLYAILLVGAVVMIGPLMWMVLSAFKTAEEIIAYPPVWFPKNPSFKNILFVLTTGRFGLFFKNSVILACAETILQLATSGLIGYILAKYRFRGANVVFIAILSMMMVPGALFLIPNYTTVRLAGILDTRAAVLIPGMFTPFGIFLMRQNFLSVPDELLDSARMDGAYEITIFLRIAAPLTKSAYAALGIFVFMAAWNSLLWPIIVFNSERLFTLPIGLSRFTNEWYSDYSKVFAGATVAVIPVLIVFFVLQKQFIRGITMTGMK